MNPLFLEIEDFYIKLQNGEFDHPLALAGVLQKLSDGAWVQVENLYQPSIRALGVRL
jgi:hypothetical protein